MASKNEYTTNFLNLFFMENLKSGDDLFAPALVEFEEISKGFIKHLPYILSAILVFTVFLLVAWFIRQLLKKRLISKGTNPLAVRAITNVFFLVFFLLGLFLSLRTSGLTGLAFTLVGGTGVLGLGLGLALRGTFENYIAGIILSLRKVFRVGDFVEINGREGVVQGVNSRSTLIMDLDGNNISIPNADVYSTTIKNFTNNPKMRTNFTVGIGYEDSINKVREIILKRLEGFSEMILQDPAPLVCVENLGSATVNLKVYFWFNAVDHSLIKIRSIVIQAVKEDLMAANVSMPDDAREIVFANPLEISKSDAPTTAEKKSEEKLESFTEPNFMDISSEASEIQKQTQESRKMEKGQNLL